MKRVCDVVVVGAGAGGLSTAIAARHAGLDVVVIEKDAVFGGTTAFSGGVLWIPGNRHSAGDSREQARRYLRQEAGAFYDEAVVEAFLDNGPKMLEFFEQHTQVRFVPTLYPDYHPEAPGGVDVGRSVLAAPYDIRGLGPDMARLRPPLRSITFMGMMFNSSNADLKHFFNVTRSLTSLGYVAKRLLKHCQELLRYRRGVQVTSGNALAARLARSALDLGIPILTSTAAHELLLKDGRISGLIAHGAEGQIRIEARRGVVLACGGFSHDLARLAKIYPHLRRGGEHFSPVPAGNTGDGLRLAEAAGAAQVQARLPNAAAWMPVSKVPLGGGKHVAFPHLLDRYKPGVIGVLRNGQRFTNEANSYHDVGEAMIQACAGQTETAMWLVCDSRTLARYGLGFVKPAPMPHGHLVRQGYLFKGRTLAELAAQTGIDPVGLARSVQQYNQGARHGEDREFHRGTSAFNRYLADPEQRPNPCVAPVEQGPFFAVKVLMGDLGTFDGLRTGVQGQVLDARGAEIAGLYAVGNDRASLMGGSYPGAGITLGPIMTFGYITGRHLAGLSDDAAVSPRKQETA